MIFGTGIDIIEVGRIKKSIQRYSDRFEQKVFTQKEIDYCHSQADPAKHFAARFSVKEAVFKCFGTGITGGVLWKAIEVDKQQSGQPVLNLHGNKSGMVYTIPSFLQHRLVDCHSLSFL